MALIRYYAFVVRWLWNNRTWKDTRQKWKALARAWEAHEEGRKHDARKSV